MPPYRIFTHQPFKAAILLLTAIAATCYLPYWLLIYLHPALRPHDQWTYNQALRVRLFRLILWAVSLIEIHTPEPLASSKNATYEFILISPPDISPSPYIGPLSCNPAVKPRNIGGSWYPCAPPPPSQSSSESKKRSIILNLHGGAYVAGTGRPDDCGYLASLYLKFTPASHIFAPQYRLASNLGNHFPAALQDAVTALFYLTRTLGYSLAEITLSGDSAGGNLALALLRWVEDFGLESGLLAKDKENETFNAVIILSLWADPFTVVRSPGKMTNDLRRRTDYLHESFGVWGARGLGLFSASSPTSTSTYSTTSIMDWEKYITFTSPHGAFKTKSRLYFEMGECEVMCDTQIGVWKAFEKVEGNRVGGAVQRTAPHDIVLMGGNLGFEVEAEKAARRIGRWMEGEG